MLALRILNQRGGITVFICIILVVVILFTLVLIDFTRIKSAEGIAASALDIAAQSTIAGYHSELKEEYGLMALYNNNHSDISEYIKESMTSNLNSNTIPSRQFQLFDFEVESVKVTLLNELSIHNVTREQIIEFMKYRAPVAFIERFISKLFHFGSITKETELLKYKTSLDKKTGNLRSAMVGLYCESKKVNEFDSSSVKLNINRIREMQKNTALTKERIAKLFSEIEKVTVNIKSIEQSAKNTSDKKAKAGYKSEIKQLDQEKEMLNIQIHELNNKVREIQNTINSSIQTIQKLILECLEANTKASYFTGELKENVKAIEGEINSVLRVIEGETGDTAKKIRLEMKRTAKSISANGLDEITFTLQENIYLLQRALIYLDNIGSITENDEEFVDIEALLAGYQYGEIYQPAPEGATEYEIQQYLDINTKKDSYKDMDVRKIVAEVSGKVMNEEEQEDVTLTQEQMVGLPSLSNETSNEVAEFLFGDKDIISQSANFNEKNDNGFSEKRFEISGGIGKALESVINGASDFKDEIYFNEYIMMSFKNMTSGTDNLREIDRLDLRGDLIVDRETAFNNGEIEYILNGSASEKTNLLLTKAEILAIRFGLNTLKIYNDAVKNSQALSLATAVAGWTGFGIPIVHTMLMCGWAFGESLIDMQILCNGGEVELYKVNWVLSLEGGVDKLKQVLLNSAIEKGSEYLDSGIDALEQKTNEILINKAEIIVNTAFEPLEQTVEGGMESTSNKIKEQIDKIGFSSEILILGEIEDYIKGIVLSKLSEAKSIAGDTISQKKEQIKKELRDAIKNGTGEAGQRLREYSVKLKQEIKKSIESGAKKIQEYMDIDNENLTKDASVCNSKDSNILASFIKLSYMDYLRIFLLLQDEEQKVRRMEDLIQLNLQKIDPTFVLSDYHTLIKVEATVSVNHLFNASSIIANKDKGKKKKIHLELYRGY